MLTIASRAKCRSANSGRPSKEASVQFSKKSAGNLSQQQQPLNGNSGLGKRHSGVHGGPMSSAPSMTSQINNQDRNPDLIPEKGNHENIRLTELQVTLRQRG